MHSKPPISLFPNPPSSPGQTQELLSDGFPPCWVQETTPESSPGSPIHSGASYPRLLSSASQDVQEGSTKQGSPSQLAAQMSSRDSRHPQLRLGKKNVVNTIEVTVQNHIPKSSSKRGLDGSHINNRATKRQRRTSLGKDDIDWIKDELKDIKICLTDISDYLRGFED